MSIAHRTLLVLCLLTLAGEALAACTRHPTQATTWYCDEQAEAMAKALSNPPKFPGSNPGPTQVSLHMNPPGYDPAGYYNSYNVYPNGLPTDSGTATFKNPTNCGNAQPITGKGVLGSATACHNGCGYTMGGNGVCIGGNEYCFASTWNPTGQVCSGGPGFNENHDPNREVCKTSGSFVHCVNSDGRQCVSSGRGSRMCWNPGEEAQRMTADGQEGASRVKDPATPQPPAAMENPTATGSQSTTINNTTYNTTTYTGTGNTGGQPSTGDGGNDGGTAGDGEGEGDGNDDEDKPGSPGAQGDALYQGSGKTFETVSAAYFARMGNAPIISAVSGFFEVSVGAGTCPVWTWPESQWLPAFTFDLFCTGVLQTILNAAGIVLLIVAARYAFHIAIGN